MRTDVQNKFRRVRKSGFQEILKPLGFVRYGNTFISQMFDIGHVVNIQKSKYCTEHDIEFTINVGLFLPAFWGTLCSHPPLSPVPSVSHLILRRRVGDLRDGNDIWYKIFSDTGENQLIAEMILNIRQYILPYFGRVLSKDMLAEAMEKETTTMMPLEKLIVFGELGESEKAGKEYERLTRAACGNAPFLLEIRRLGKKYGLSSHVQE